MAQKKRNILPHDWRLQVSKRLAAQGTELTSQQVYDVYRARITDEVLVEKVGEAMAEVKQQYRRKQVLMSRLKKIAAFFILLF